MKLKVKSASCWPLLYRYITMHGPQNIMFMDLVGPEREEVKGDWR
jgi:hypothetical protein